MLKELFAITTGDAPIKKAEGHFAEMLQLVEGMIIAASEFYWGEPKSPEQRTDFYEKDARVNKLQREVRRDVVTHLSGSELADVPYSLMLMSLVKDVERIGDYAKNLTQIPAMSHPVGAERQLPQDEVVEELREIANGVERLMHEAPLVYIASDVERAKEITVIGRSVAKRCDKLIGRIAAADYPGHLAVDLTLATRYYKRIQGHLLNLLSSILMPLDKLDYFDEDALPHD